MIKIKICGITNEADALVSIEAGADALGFVFAKSSRRVTPGTVKKIIGNLPPFITKVGVFVNDVPSLICKIARECMLNVVQLHGEEIPEFCKEISLSFPVIKSVRVRNENDVRILEAYKESAKAFLLDTYVEEAKGGTGKSFNWDFCRHADKFKKPIVLAGGLNKNNVRDAILKVKPYAVDVSSGVEKSPGKKDHKKLKEFIKIVRESKL